MAKKTVAAPAAQAVPAKLNLFKKAGEKKENEKKRPPTGTIIQLPAEMETVDGKRQLTAESVRLNDAIVQMIEAKADADAAANRDQIAKNDVTPFVKKQYAHLIAREGMLPKTPITVVNVDGRSVTFVIQDRTTSTGLSDEQIEGLQALIGVDIVNDLVFERDAYAFDPKVMGDIAGEIPDGADAETVAALPKVQDIVFEIVSETLLQDDRLTADQKENLIACTTKKLLKENTLNRIVEFTGQDPQRIEQFYNIVGSAVPRYFKV